MSVVGNEVVNVQRESERGRHEKKSDAQRDVPEQEPEHQKHQYGHQYRRWVHLFYVRFY